MIKFALVDNSQIILYKVDSIISAKVEKIKALWINFYQTT